MLLQLYHMILTFFFKFCLLIIWQILKHSPDPQASFSSLTLNPASHGDRASEPSVHWVDQAGTVLSGLSPRLSCSTG